MKYGTIDHRRQNGEDFFTVSAEFEVELMLKRLMPTHMFDPLSFRIHPENTRMLRMVMKEYPLQIKTKKWDKAIEEINGLKQLAEKVSKLDYLEPDEVHFNGELLPFQKQGLDFMLKTKGNTLVTDEMGLGKTIETLAFISRKLKMPVIVVAPLVVLINWQREIQKFLTLTDNPPDHQRLIFENERRVPNIHIIRHGIRKDVKHDLPPADFYLINYELVAKRFADLKAVNPKIIVYDEIHSLRNDYTGKYTACMALGRLATVKHRIGLSGTPIYNKGIEMFNVCEIIKSGVLGERPEFIRKYCMNWYSDKTSEQGKVGLSRLLRNTIMIRRKKIDVLKDLPEKIRMKQSIPIDDSMYEAELQKLYDKIEVAKEQLVTYSEDDKKEGLFQINKRIREMRVAERQIAGLAKAPHVVEYLDNLLEDYDDEKFVVFCHHINVHKVIFDGLWKYNPLQIIGGQSDKKRQEAIDKFQNEKENRVIICGLRAGNLGINLTSSAYVIFAELDWSPSIHRQAEDRLHRIGQKNNVFAHYLEGAGTFDEILSQVLLNKTVLISDVLGDKMEHLDNKKAVEFLESKFKLKTSSKIAELITQKEV